MKTCTHCQIAKPLDEFHRHPEQADGRDHRCKPCAKKARAELRLRNLQLFRDRDNARYARRHL